MAPVTEPVETLTRKIIKSRRERHSRRYVGVITDALGVEQRDVARWIGVHENTVSSWVSGSKRPSEERIVLLDLIHQGLVRVRGDDLVVESCPRAESHPDEHNDHTDYHLRRYGSVDRCDACGHEQPASDDLAVDQDALE